MNTSRSHLVHALALVMLLLPSVSFAQAGPPGGMIYANDEAYRTVEEDEIHEQDHSF